MSNYPATRYLPLNQSTVSVGAQSFMLTCPAFGGPDMMLIAAPCGELEAALRATNVKLLEQLDGAWLANAALEAECNALRERLLALSPKAEPVLPMPAFASKPWSLTASVLKTWGQP